MPPFNCFILWRRDLGVSNPLAPCPPCSYAVNADKRISHAVADRQSGVGKSKFAFEPLNAVVDSQPKHFERALSLANDAILPWDSENPLDLDLRFAIQQTVLNKQGLRGFRDEAMLGFTALKSRCKPLTDRLVAAQPPSVHAVAKGMDLGLMAALCVCMRWLDRDLVADFIRGFPIVGELPTSGVLRVGGKDAEGSIP